jgi:hypothetical protein
MLPFTSYLLSSMLRFLALSQKTDFDRGWRKLDDLRKHAEPTMTRQQKLGLKHYDDISRRIPRYEVAALEAHVLRAARRLCPGKFNHDRFSVNSFTRVCFQTLTLVFTFFVSCLNRHHCACRRLVSPRIG